MTERQAGRKGSLNLSFDCSCEGMATSLRSQRPRTIPEHPFSDSLAFFLFLIEPKS